MPEVIDKTETCRDCDGTDGVIDILCEDCESEYDLRCEICNEFYKLENYDKCRHVFWHDDFCSMGAGALSSDWDEGCKESFFAVLKKTRLSEQLRTAIQSKNYFLQYYGSMFGHDGLHCYLNGRDYGKRFTLDLTDDEEEAMSNGVGWLMSLWSGGNYDRNYWPEGRTPDGDTKTIEWIDEYHAVHAKDAEGAD